MERLPRGDRLRLERIESVARSAGWDARYLQRHRGPLEGTYSAVTGQGTTLAWGEANPSVHAIGAHCQPWRR
ncbi:MAG: hypothetical protein IPN92_17565 [Chromatiaceae bacterium]|nr:hypothetical protein [Chromatiaceae bacterium]